MSPDYTYGLRCLLNLAVVRMIFILQAHNIDTKWDVTCKSHSILLFTTYYHHRHNHCSHHRHHHHHHHQGAVYFEQSLLQILPFIVPYAYAPW